MRHWRSRLLLGCLVLAAVAVLTMHAGPGTAHHGSSAGRATAAPRLRRTASARPAARSPTVLTVGRHLLGVTAGWQLFARGPADLIAIQLARGRITLTAVPQLVTGNPIVAFLVGPHEAIVRSSDLVPGYVIPDGSPARQLTGPLAGSGPLIPGPDPGHAWVMSGTVVHPSLSLVGLNGSPTGVFIRVPPGGPELPATAFPDGRGYVLMQDNVFDLYDAGPSWDRIVPATVIATGPARWLVIGCNAAYQRCRNEVMNPATGAWRVLPGRPLAGPYGLYNQQLPPLGVVSPDGSTAAVPVPGKYGNVMVRLVDLRSGASHPIPVQLAAVPSNESMVWSPDGNWLFVVGSGGRLLAVNAHSRQVQGLGVTLPYVTQVAIRDAPG